MGEEGTILNIKKVLIKILYYYYKILKPKFIFNNKKYDYFCNRYNLTWTNERAVEIPIVADWIRERKNGKFLEIGNVLSHYFKTENDVVDKYEKSEGVINKDVVNFKPKKKYNLIASISTLEHVGWDEDKKDSRKILKAINNLKKNCLAPNGSMIITMPLGYNEHLTELLRNKSIPFKEGYYLKRISRTNKWKQVGWENVKDIKYDFKSCRANAILIGIIY